MWNFVSKRQVRENIFPFVSFRIVLFLILFWYKCNCVEECKAFCCVQSVRSSRFFKIEFHQEKRMYFFIITFLLLRFVQFNQQLISFSIKHWKLFTALNTGALNFRNGIEKVTCKRADRYYRAAIYAPGSGSKKRMGDREDSRERSRGENLCSQNSPRRDRLPIIRA